MDLMSNRLLTELQQLIDLLPEDDIPEEEAVVYDHLTFATVECVIPKGSHYYEGEFNNLPSYASDTIVYINKMTIYDVIDYTIKMR